MRLRFFFPCKLIFLNKVRNYGIQVIHLQLITADDETNWYDKQFRKGEEGAKILPQVWNDKDMIIEKPKDSGFFQTKLDEILKKLNVHTVIITGMQTQICVQTTAADAYFRVYKVLIPSDVVVSTKELDTERALTWMAKYCATVMNSNDILQKIKDDFNRK